MFIENKINYLFTPYKQLRQVNLCRKLLLGYVLFNSLQNMLVAALLYDPAKSVIATGTARGLSMLSATNLLSIDFIAGYYWLFISLQFFFALLAMVGAWPRISTFLVFFIGLNLQHRIYATVCGGDTLVYILLFYMSFVSSGKQEEKPLSLANVFNRIFGTLCILQVLLVYTVSALYKIQSPQWIDGSALSSVLQVDEYSLPWLKEVFSDGGLLLKVLTWFVLLYQIVFPVLVFNRKLKNYVLITGLLIHLGIALVVGLLNFSLVMACTYALFYETDTGVNSYRKTP